MIKNKPVLNSDILQRMQMLCSRQERCANDIRKRLVELNLPKQEIDRIIEILLKDNFINDERYAISFTHDKLRFNKWGKIKINYELKRKGISDVHILKALENIDSIEYIHVIKSELIKKFKKSKSSNEFTLKNKLMRFGQSKGFETELVFSIINEILSTND